MKRHSLTPRQLFIILATVGLAGCASTTTAEPGTPVADPDRETATDWTGLPSPSAMAVLDATLWLQTSAEYVAMSRQIWRAAERLLPEALADTTWSAALEQQPGAGTLPPAVIVDVDETILDNAPYAARLIERDESFTEESWAAWVEQAKAHPVPGALEFVRAARDLDIEVFYVTNRLANLEQATRRNLDAMGFPPGEAEDVHLLLGEREEWGSDKTTRRAWVAERYRVLLLAGDDLNDFLPARGLGVETRAELTERHEDRWGTQWIVFANPTYGSWVSAVLEGLEPRSPAAVNQRKLESLRPRWD
ncbi:MAG: 5'-nucleotidase, lipoprotein e(P4) family [Gemmatimonadota bacterium]